jgi:peptide/nickel transport system ATP-binding protein
MLFWLTQFSDGGDFFNLFRYITFRTGGATATALFFVFFFGPRIITGLLPPRSGQILFQDKALPATLKERSKELKRTIQLVYQIPDVAINPRQTLREIIGRPVEFYFGVGRAEVNARAEELMTLVELPQDYLERRPGQLSGGQKQRV